MRLAYLLIFIPGVMVALAYFALFRSMGLQIRAYPFIVAAVAVVAACLLVRHYQRRRVKRRGSAGS